jgi:hypothetical protein
MVPAVNAVGHIVRYIIQEFFLRGLSFSSSVYLRLADSNSKLNWKLVSWANGIKLRSITVSLGGGHWVTGMLKELVIEHNNTVEYS